MDWTEKAIICVTHPREPHRCGGGAFPIEQICKEVEREMTDKNLNILEDILGYIEAFSRYEEILALNDQGVKCVG